MHENGKERAENGARPRRRNETEFLTGKEGRRIERNAHPRRKIVKTKIIEKETERSDVGITDSLHPRRKKNT